MKIHIEINNNREITVYHNVYRKRKKNCYIKSLYAYRHTIQICVAISIVYVIVSITCKLQIDRNIYKINKL